MSTFLLRNLTDDDTNALKKIAESEGVSMNDVALRAIRDATSRRAEIRGYLVNTLEKHADTLAELADR